MAALTPMMEQYFKIKNEYKYCLVMFRLGDFYELFFDDALIASKELGLVLTGRDCGQKERAPMCGVPHHAANGYIARLVEKGYKVAVCEQMEDPKATKNIVKRDVVRVVTPGTVIDDNVLDKSKNNYIMSLFGDKNGVGIACADVSTGEFTAYSLTKTNKTRLNDEISMFAPAEIIISEEFEDEQNIQSALSIKPTKYADWAYVYSNAYVKLCNHFQVLNLNGFGFSEKDDKHAISAAGALIQYLSETQKNSLFHITALKPYKKELFMVLDTSSRRNLELTETMRSKEKKGSLLWVLDNTKTAMGARTLRKWIEQPLVETDEICARLDAVEEGVVDPVFRLELKTLFADIHDIERIMARVVYQSANARDLSALKKSFHCLPEIKELLKNKKKQLFLYFSEQLDPLIDLYGAIDKTIIDEPPVSIREGGMINDGINDELDMHREAKNKGATWLIELEVREKEQSGIKNLKIRFNKVFGYYLEVTNSYKNLVPEHFIRRQTLANCERYTTDELKKIEEAILGADEKINNIEYEIFIQLRDKMADNMARIQQTANMVAAVDAILSLSEVAENQRYVKPDVLDNGMIDIKDGRHPVVEKLINTSFIPNDTMLDLDENRLSIITGPNMAGKSTYMRQTALICLMAQAGSFVPAGQASIGVVDRIFTRVGASDDLATGQSTFMVEMVEVANIIHNATNRSLLILDEIGRGTSTFDGLSIAWSVLEYIANKIGAKSLFATHYHELTELEGKVDGVANYRVLVKEHGEDILFLRKIVRGSADHSYGIQVARLAGVPNIITERAKTILSALNQADIVHKPVDDEITNIVTYSRKKKDYNTYKIFINEILSLGEIDKMTLKQTREILQNLKALGKSIEI